MSSAQNRAPAQREPLRRAVPPPRVSRTLLCNVLTPLGACLQALIGGAIAPPLGTALSEVPLDQVLSERSPQQIAVWD